MFNRISIRTALAATLGSLLLIVPASAAVRTASDASTTLTVGAVPVSYGTLDLQCVTSGDVGSGFKLSFSNEMAGLSFVGNATLTFAGSWTGDTTAKTVAVSTDGLSYQPGTMPSCNAGGTLTITGLSLRYTGGVTTEQTHLLVLPKTGAATAVVARSIALMGTTVVQQAAAPKVVKAEFVDTPVSGGSTDGDGTIDTLVVTFDSPLSTTATITPSDWTLTAGTWGPIQIDSVVGVESSTKVVLRVSGFAGTGDSTPSHSTAPTLSLRSGSGVKNTQGTSAVGFIDIAIADTAVPRVKTAVVSDTNGNGRYDQVKLTFTENVGVGTITLSQALAIFRVYDGSPTQNAPLLFLTSIIRDFGSEITLNFVDATAGVTPTVSIMSNVVLKDGAANAVVPGNVTVDPSGRYPVMIASPLTIPVPPATVTPPATTPVPTPVTTPEPTPISTEISYPSIRINNQANYTKSQSVTLDLYAVNATQMQIANSSNLTSATWVDYATSKSWTLTSGKGTKTVCVRYRNAARTSTTECDTILFDSAAKEPSAMSVVINKGNSNTTSTLVTLAIKATNAAEMRISNSSDMSGSNWIAYKTSVAWNLVGGSGDRTVYVQFRSSSLIESAVVSDVITLGTPYVYTPQQVQQYASLVPGDLIKLPNDGDPTTTHDQTVYYFGADGKRHAFPSQKVYESWFVGFGSVKMISLDTLSTIPLGAPMLVRPGTYLVKSPSMNRVYVVTAGGVLRPLKNEAAAVKHFGKAWGSRVIDLADGFFASYTMNSSEYTESSVLPDGVVVEAGGVRWYVESGDLYPFTSNGFADNGFQERFVIQLEKKPNYSTKSSINGRTDKYSKFYYRDATGSLIGV